MVSVAELSHPGLDVHPAGGERGAAAFAPVPRDGGVHVPVAARRVRLLQLSDPLLLDSRAGLRQCGVLTEPLRLSRIRSRVSAGRPHSGVGPVPLDGVLRLGKLVADPLGCPGLLALERARTRLAAIRWCLAGGCDGCRARPCAGRHAR